MFPVIFYVDDDIDDLSIFEAAASDLGLEVRLFHNGYELLAELENANPDNTILFADLNMPIINGYELISAIRKSEKFNHLPVISFSTSKEPESIGRCREAGANLYIQKPNDFDSIVNAIKYVLSINWKNEISLEEDFLFTFK